MSYAPIDPMKRFLEKTDRRAVGSCWMWLGAIKDSGYGNFYLRGSSVSAHRASWELHRGPIPDGLSVLHRCDNKRCVNPGHLFLGSQLENMQDKIKKGRSTPPPCTKLTKQSVSEIRTRLEGGEQGRVLAREFGVHEATISFIKSGRIWQNI